MNNKFEQLKQVVASLEEDSKKFYESNNKAAGTRLRKGLMEIKNLAGEARTQVSELKK